MRGKTLTNNNKLERDRQLRSLALQIVTQLPDDPAEACAVLRHAERLVWDFLNEKPPAGPRGVVPIRRT